MNYLKNELELFGIDHGCNVSIDIDNVVSIKTYL